MIVNRLWRRRRRVCVFLHVDCDRRRVRTTWAQTHAHTHTQVINIFPYYVVEVFKLKEKKEPHSIRLQIIFLPPQSIFDPPTTTTTTINPLGAHSTRNINAIARECGAKVARVCVRKLCHYLVRANSFIILERMRSEYSSSTICKCIQEIHLILIIYRHIQCVSV